MSGETSYAAPMDGFDVTDVAFEGKSYPVYRAGTAPE